MPKARATEPISLWHGYGPVSVLVDDIVDGDFAAQVLADPSLPFVEISDEPEAPKKPTAKKSAAAAKPSQS